MSPGCFSERQYRVDFCFFLSLFFITFFFASFFFHFSSPFVLKTGFLRGLFSMMIFSFFLESFNHK